MIEADRLNREAALLSNTLADFEDNDVSGRTPVVEAILSYRKQWKYVRYEIQNGTKHPDLENVSKPKPTEISLGLSEAEVRLELQKIRVNICKNENKLLEKPEHKNAMEWETELDRLKAIKDNYEIELIRLRNEKRE